MSDRVSNPFEIRIPVLFRLNRNRKNSLNIDFRQLTNYYPFSEKYIVKLKRSFEVQEREEITAVSVVKRKLEELISTGKYTSLRELAEATGYSHSYVCRVLKYKK